MLPKITCSSLYNNKKTNGYIEKSTTTLKYRLYRLKSEEMFLAC